MANSLQSIDDYLQVLPETSREIIARIRSMISEAAPDSIEGIKYGMPTATVDGTNIIYYAAWKKHIGLYPIYSGPAAFERQIARYRDKKDMVRFQLGTAVPFDIIGLILTTRIESLSTDRKQNELGIR